MKSVFKYEAYDSKIVNVYLADYCKSEIQIIDSRLIKLIEEAKLLTPELFNANKVIINALSNLTETDYFPLRYRP